MRLRFGPVPDDPGFAPEDGGWVRLKEPSFGRMMLMALPLSFVLVAGITLAWVRAGVWAWYPDERNRGRR